MEPTLSVPGQTLTGEVTYHRYQQILNLQSGDTSLKQRRVRKKFSKSRDGCLNCKRRRKKCDEVKPECKGCARNKLSCVWPDHVKTHTANAKETGIIPDHKPEYTNSTEMITVVNDDDMEPSAPSTPSLSLSSSYNFSNLFDDLPLKDEIFEHDFDSGLLLDQFINIQTENINCQSPTRSFVSNRRDSSDTETAPNDFGTTIPGVPMSKRDSLYYSIFLNTFMTSISPPHCPPLISPTNVILPFAVTHPIVREIFFACGATLLAYDDESYKHEAHERYVKVVDLLINEIKHSKEGCDDHLFISVQLLQTLCLRDKNIGLNATKTAAHLSASYEIIKKRFLKQEKSNYSPTLRILPLDRVLTEHFLINYPITIMLCRHDKLLQCVPSPFQFFEQFGTILSKPFNESNTDPWLNHPILGLSLKAYEIAAKCSWMCRLMKMPLRQEQLLTCLELKHQANENLRYLEALEKDEFDNLTPAQRNNIFFSKSKIFACLIILKKLCHYENTTIESLQSEVDSIISSMKSSKGLTDVFVNSVWALFIGGSSALTQERKDFFRVEFKQNAETIRSSLCLKILKYLEIIWEEDQMVDPNQSHSIPKNQAGFEFLFDTTVLDIVCT